MIPSYTVSKKTDPYDIPEQLYSTGRLLMIIQLIIGEKFGMGREPLAQFP